MGLLPSEPDVSSDAGTRVVSVDSDDADDLLSALSSGTARRILARLHEDPAPPSRVADQVDTSLQNVQYHLERLEDAGAVEVAGTAYSEKGREMNLYAPADQPLVIFAGREDQSSGLRAALSRLLGGVGALAFGALLVQEAFGEGVVSRFVSTGAGGDGGAAGGGGPTPTEATDLTVSNASGTATSTPTTADQSTTTSATPTATSDGGVSIMGGTATPTPSGTPTAVADVQTAVATETATAAPTAEPTPTATELARTATEAATRTAASGGAADPFAPLSLPPGVLFLLGGVLVLGAGIALTTGR
jgi:DNA-binding transcriptional ArsR family regulator